MIKLKEVTIKGTRYKICPFCEYKWKPRKNDPVSCVRCKRRFDYDEVRKG